MDDTIRLNLAGCDETFIHDALTGFLEQAAVHHRALVEIRVGRTMLDTLKTDRLRDRAFFQGVPVTVCDTGFAGTVEVVFGPPPSTD